MLKTLGDFVWIKVRYYDFLQLLSSTLALYSFRYSLTVLPSAKGVLEESFFGLIVFSERKIFNFLSENTINPFSPFSILECQNRTKTHI